MPITHIIAAAASASALQKQQPVKPNGYGHCCHNEPARQVETETRAVPANHPVIIDTDAGIDDAWALMMMIQAHKNSSIPFHIEGITCVHGRTSVDNVVKNVGRVLSVTNSVEIPIYRGCESAFAIPFKEPGDDDPFNGQDGFGDAKLPMNMVLPKVQDEHAVNAITRLAELYKGSLTILTLGPLTNLAVALRMNPKIKHYIKEVFVYGGNTEGNGNATVSGEFNFVGDVESAHVVLTSLACPIYLIPWETCLKHTTCPYSWRLNTIGTIQTEQMKLLNAIESNILNDYRDGWMACESVAAAVLINPTVVVNQELFHCVVELHGTYSRGLLIVDRGYKFNKNPNVMIVTEIDLELLQRMLIWAVGGPLYLQ